MQSKCFLTLEGFWVVRNKGCEREEILESSCHLCGKRRFLRYFFHSMNALLSLVFYFKNWRKKWSTLNSLCFSRLCLFHYWDGITRALALILVKMVIKTWNLVFPRPHTFFPSHLGKSSSFLTPWALWEMTRVGLSLFPQAPSHDSSILAELLFLWSFCHMVIPDLHNTTSFPFCDLHIRLAFPLFSAVLVRVLQGKRAIRTCMCVCR